MSEAAFGFHSLFGTRKVPEADNSKSSPSKIEEDLNKEKELEDARVASQKIEKLVSGKAAVNRKKSTKSKKKKAVKKI